jgi:hypothetical protein
MNAGKITFDIGPLFTVLPWMSTVASALVPDSWTSVRAVLAAHPDASVTFSAGPVWEYQQATNKGYYRTFTGVAMRF